MTVPPEQAVPPPLQPPPLDPPARLFVEPQTYRRRRFMDAIRALPVLGVLLWTVPMLWPAGDSAPSASSALIYIFAVWVLLVLGAGLLIRRLSHHADSDKEDAP